MSSNLKTDPTARSAGVDALLASCALNSGFMDIYDGTQPASPATAVTTQNKLARLTLNATAFAAAVSGVATAGAIASGLGLFAGTPTLARLLTAAGVAKMDGTCGLAASSPDFTISASPIAVNATISCSSLTYGIP